MKCAHTDHACVGADPLLRPSFAHCCLQNSKLLNTNTTRPCTHLSASSGPSLLCGCGTPTARSRPQNKQMWLITSLSVLSCDTRAPLSDYFRPQLIPSQWTLMFFKDQPTATPVLSLTPKGSHWHSYSENQCMSASHLVIVFVSLQITLVNLMLPAKTLFSELGPVTYDQHISYQTGATCCYKGEEPVLNIVV